MATPEREEERDERLDDHTSELLRRWHDGERAALDELVRRNLGWLRNHVRARLGRGCAPAASRTTSCRRR